MATTSFADPPDDRSSELELDHAAPPPSIAVHTSYYRDDECCIRFTFIAPIELTAFLLGPPECSTQ